MLSRKELDREFVLIYEELVGLSRSLAYKYKKRHEASAVVNEAYLYLVSKQTEILEAKSVRIYAIKFIRDGLKWTNSSINKKGETRRRGLFSLVEECDGQEEQKDSEKALKKGVNEILVKEYVDGLQDLEEKIETERRETAFKVLLAHYKKEAKDPVLRRLLEVYAEQKVDTVRKLADYYGFSKDSAAIEIRELVADVRQFAEKKGYLSTFN